MGKRDISQLLQSLFLSKLTPLHSCLHYHLTQELMVLLKPDLAFSMVPESPQETLQCLLNNNRG